MISVIIPAYNEEGYIGACLDALAKQRVSEDWEVIVADNASTDRTTDVAMSYAGRVPVRIVREETKGRGAARAAGFAAAKGDLLLSTDADTVVPPNWVADMAARLRAGDAVAVTGPCSINDCGRVNNAVFNVLQPLAMRCYQVPFRHYWLSGFNFGITRDAYHAAGGFNPAIDSLEDLDLSRKVNRVGTIAFAPRLPVRFSGRRFQKSMLLGLGVYSVHFVQMFILKKHPKLSDVR